MTEQTEPGSQLRLPDTPRMERVRAIIEPSLEAMGYEVVRLHETGGQRPVVQVMADRQDGAAMTVDDCAAISRSVSASSASITSARGRLAANISTIAGAASTPVTEQRRSAR